MPSYTTHGPVRVAIDLAAAEVTIVASDRRDAVVDVAPFNPAMADDVKSAEQVEVDFGAGKLRVKQPWPWRHRYGKDAAPGTVSLSIALPTGSEVRANASLCTLRSQGRLGKSQFNLSSGQLELDEIDGDLRIRINNGSILVQRAHGNVDARTNIGNIVVGEVLRGTVDLTTTVGEVEVGVHPNVAADLNARSRLGRIRNTLPPESGGSTAGSATATVKIHARTKLDDIVIRRS